MDVGDAKQWDGVHRRYTFCYAARHTSRHTPPRNTSRHTSRYTLRYTSRRAVGGRASESDGAKRNLFVLWLETTQTIASLDYVCRYTTYAAQRLGNIVVKRKPSASLMPKPADLYQHQVEV